jgi:cell division protein FtsL
MIPVSYVNHMSTQSQRPSRKLVRLSLVSSRLIGFLILAILALFYIAQSTGATTKRVEVQSLRSQADTMETEQADLELNITRMKALDTITQSAGQLGLEPVTSVEHLSQ